MRYRVIRDFILEGTLLAWGDALYLKQAPDDRWEVYSLWTRKMVGLIKSEEIKLYLVEVQAPSEKNDRRRSGGRSLKDTPLVLLMFILPLWGIAQINVPIPGTSDTNHIRWRTGIVQTGDNIYELHLLAHMDNNYFMYPVNNRKNCNLGPTIRFEPNTSWILVDGPALYTYGNKLPKETNSRYCPTERYTDSILYICTFEITPGATQAKVKGIIEYYNTQLEPYPCTREKPQTYGFSRTLFYKAK